MGDSGIAVRLDATNKAYVNVSSSSISAALGYVPANTNSIKEIPTVLPNPFPLCITAGGSETVYTGATQSNINVDGFYTKKMIYEISREHVGNGGYIHSLTQSWALTGNETYSEDNPDSIIIVPFNCAVTTTRNPKVKTSEGFNSITSTSGYKCYCFTRITDNLILANVQIYI
ncbi:hypothetical protein [Clostridium sp.]|uniref:hypothetical protein n=1 Tax=Clostridium sp. TaxID=1506 RepID=UPI002FC8308D